jgi:hypothetical protein
MARYADCLLWKPDSCAASISNGRITKLVPEEATLGNVERTGAVSSQYRLRESDQPIDKNNLACFRARKS